MGGEGRSRDGGVSILFTYFGGRGESVMWREGKAVGSESGKNAQNTLEL